jgi:hypothetical protein
MRRTIAAVLAGVTTLALLTGCAGRADDLPGAVTSKACTATAAQAKAFATRPSLVRTTKAASCVFAYVDAFVPTRGFTAAATIAYTVEDDHEYGDAGGDGILITRARGTYDPYSRVAYEIDQSYDETASLYGKGSDSTSLRYLDQRTGSVLVAQPQEATGWSRTTAAEGAGAFTLNRAHLFPQTSFAITAWRKSASKGRNTWTFTLGDRLAGGTATFVVASTGELLSGRTALHWDGHQHTRLTTFTGSYGRVRNVSIPPEVVSAAR